MIEIQCGDLVAARRALVAVPAIRSIAQLGNRLRVLMPRAARDPEGELRTALASQCPDARVERVGASLEDVFVAATRLRKELQTSERAA